MIDQQTVTIIATMLAGIGGGIALVAWTENQGKRTDQRVNLQPCVECKGETTTKCNVCNGTAKDPLDAAKACSYCDGRGANKCFNCAGSGLQPRYLDRYGTEILIPTYADITGTRRYCGYNVKI